MAPAFAPQGRAGCDGLTVSRVDIYTYRPSERTAGERAAAATTDAVGLDHRRTRQYVIRAYLRLEPGDRCTEQRRRESERMLRAQRFVASAAVTAIPEGDGRVRIRVDVVDEVPWVSAARFRGLAPAALQVGTQNLGGRGVTLIVGAERGYGYRPGSKVLVGQSGALGRPALADAEWHLRPLGGLMRLGYSEPFLTDGQRGAISLSALQDTDYPTLVRLGEEDAAVRTRRTAYHAAVIGRVGSGAAGRTVGLGGLMVMGTDVRSSENVVIRSDSGLVPTGDTVLVGRYPNFADGRVALLVGVRRLTFKTVRRFETLRAEQDVASGYELDFLVGPSFDRSRNTRNVLYATQLYLGRAGATSFASLRLRAEGRQTAAREGWEGVVTSGRLSWHRLTSPTRTRIFTGSVASVRSMAFPMQLTFRDYEGGLIGFPESREGGGHRAVLRVEERALVPWFSRRAGIAVGLFADAGQIWAGDVPYGVTSPVRASVGFSLMGSYPVNSKRMYRLDVGFPLNAARGEAGIAFRLTSGDRTGIFWSEPSDVERARAGTGPVSLMRW